MERKIKLGVNIDHVATLRNARGGKYPEISNAAIIVEKSGADLLTVHVREDRRHINEYDLAEILNIINIPLNLEIAANSEMIGIANKYNPHSVCFVPEKREEITTEGGLDIVKNFKNLKNLIIPTLENKINVSVFIDPKTDQLMAAKDLGIKTVEFHTGAYADAHSSGSSVEIELNKIRECVVLAKQLSMNCNAGHGLNFDNVSLVASITGIDELNIGHFIIADSIFNGLQNSISKMRNIIMNATK